MLCFLCWVSLSQSFFLLSKLRGLCWTRWPRVPPVCAAVSRFGSDTCAGAATDPKLPAATVHSRPEDEPARASADAAQHSVPSAAVQGQASADYCAPHVGKVRHLCQKGYNPASCCCKASIYDRVLPVLILCRSVNWVVFITSYVYTCTQLFDRIEMFSY